MVVISSFTHLYALTNTPGIWWDEGTYIGRGVVTVRDHLFYPAADAMESNVAYYGTDYYGHPFLGWGVLAFAFLLLGYPGNLAGQPNSVDTLAAYFAIPRAVVGALAIADTVLMYAVGTRAHGRPRHGLAAAALFALSPITRQVLYVQLDNFMAFWVLLALHLALVSRDREAPRRRLLYAALAGLAFGAALLTKLPALYLVPVFPVVFLLHGVRPPFLRFRRPGKTPPGLRWVSLLLWGATVLAVATTWILYAASRGETDRLINGLEIFANREPGGWPFDVLLTRFFRDVDPFFFYLGLAGLAYALLRRRPVVASWAILYMVYLYILPNRIQYYYLPLVIPFALLGGFLLADVAVWLPWQLENAMHRRRTGAPTGGASTAAALILGLLLLVPATQMAAALGQDRTTPRLQALEWVVRNVPPDSVVVANRAFLFVLHERRPDLWAIHQVQTDTVLLDRYIGAGGVGPTEVLVTDARHRAVFQGEMANGQSVDLPAAEYHVQGFRGGASVGDVDLDLDRDQALVFVAQGLRVVQLWAPGAGATAGVHRMTVLSPTALPIYYLDDGVFTLPRGLQGMAVPAHMVYTATNGFVGAYVYRLNP